MTALRCLLTRPGATLATLFVARVLIPLVWAAAWCVRATEWFWIAVAVYNAERTRERLEVDPPAEGFPVDLYTGRIHWPAR